MDEDEVLHEYLLLYVCIPANKASPANLPIAGFRKKRKHEKPP
jgi:hypothetical protein